MMALLLAVSVLFAQGVPVLTNQGGSVVGLLRTAAGDPAVGVRVAALAPSDATNDPAPLSSFAGLTETDSAGRYRLENIPPGRYYIVAGRIDAPTYYPGAVQASEGTVVAIAAGAAVSGINFVLNNGSVGRANGNLFAGNASWVVPIQTRIEDGGKVPLFAAGRFPVLRFAHSNGTKWDVTLNVPNVTLSEPGNLNSSSGVYRVTVENLPEGYRLQSLTFGSTDLRVDAMQLPKANAGAIVPQNVVVTMAVLASSQAVGVRVSGRIRGAANRSIYISGQPGAIYADESFEFAAVKPGRHTITTVDSSGVGHSLGVSLVVGDRDLPNIELEEISAAPADFDRPTPPSPAGNHLAGSKIPPASIHARVVDPDTHEPFNAGKAMLNGNFSASFALNDDGRFDIPKLLPGSYVVDVVVYGIGSVSRTVVIDEQDTTLELSVSP